MASQALSQGEDLGIQFALPGGLILAEDASVAQHMASHSRAVEQAAASQNPQGTDVDRRTGVPEDVLKALPVMSFADALIKEGEKEEDPASDNKIIGDVVKLAQCCKVKKIPGLQVDSEDEDRTCEICQSGYELEDKVLMLPCKHFYHSECVSRWLDIRKTCPKCRHQVSPSDEADEAEGQGIIVRRTTTIEWVPVVRWVPSSSTTVEVRSSVGSDIETVTTTTTRNTSINTGHASLLANSGIVPPNNVPAVPTPNAVVPNANAQPQPQQTVHHHHPAGAPAPTSANIATPRGLPNGRRFTVVQGHSINGPPPQTPLPQSSPSEQQQQQQQQQQHHQHPLPAPGQRNGTSRSPSQGSQRGITMAMPPLGPSARLIQSNIARHSPQHRRAVSLDSSPQQQVLVVQLEPRSPNVQPISGIGAITPPLLPRGPIFAVPPMGDVVETAFLIL